MSPLVLALGLGTLAAAGLSFALWRDRVEALRVPWEDWSTDWTLFGELLGRVGVSAEEAGRAIGDALLPAVLAMQAAFEPLWKRYEERRLPGEAVDVWWHRMIDRQKAGQR